MGKHPRPVTALWAGLALALLAAGRVGAQELTEGNASGWGTFAADNRTARVSNGTSYVKFGAYSLRFDTASGFDTGVRFPVSGSAHWDLSGKNYLSFWAIAVNLNASGFQDEQPIIVLKSRITRASSRMRPV